MWLAVVDKNEKEAIEEGGKTDGGAGRRYRDGNCLLEDLEICANNQHVLCKTVSQRFDRSLSLMSLLPVNKAANKIASTQTFNTICCDRLETARLFAVLTISFMHYRIMGD